MRRSRRHASFAITAVAGIECKTVCTAKSCLSAPSETSLPALRAHALPFRVGRSAPCLANWVQVASRGGKRGASMAHPTTPLHRAFHTAHAQSPTVHAWLTQAAAQTLSTARVWSAVAKERELSLNERAGLLGRKESQRAEHDNEGEGLVRDVDLDACLHGRGGLTHAVRPCCLTLRLVT